ncbi:NAD(P)/FAD-dependent oxidoreductase [Caminibacter profundus]
MKSFDFVIIGGGIAGLLTAWFFKDKKILLIDKKEVLSGASGAAGAFLFPKVGYNTEYTRFINDGIVEAVKFYNDIGVSTYTKGVLILPRDERDIAKFQKYEEHIKLPFVKKDKGFYFNIGSVVDPGEVKEKIKVPFEKLEVKKIEKKDNFWIINDLIKTKNIILATGYEELIDIPYIKIRPIWGEKIEINGKWKMKNEKLKKGVPEKSTDFLGCYFHKNCSVGLIDGILKIGATHKRDCKNCKENLEEAYELIKKAKEIIDISEYKILDIKGGFRASSVDYFPVVGKIIDIRKTLLEDKHIVKGDVPKKIFYIDGLYIINGMGARGFSNAYICAKKLRDYIEKNEKLGILDTKRLFIKWARKEGEKYLNEKWRMENGKYNN